ncbi:hypothetical protein [Paenibacillus sp. GP183]|uniref:hypothetical protein n=1 Tax=Paenibacillus sp. GP183 TaxID=1882751 RepID=UPI00089AB289|nr:hypothetical protein [Paenibacillus sp. GP183]SEB90028.1 hypothetical protein SAMN05443246_2289 [Paenibacillus sp. GP183]
MAPSFDPGITEYQIYADELNKSINLLPFQVSSKVQLNIAGEGVKSTFTDGVFHIDINGISSFKLEVRSLENKTLLKTYQFSISNWLSLAAAHADGTEAVLILKKELDTTYVMDPARFAFDQAGVTVMGAQYDMQDTTHHTIRLKMSTNKGLAPNVNTIKLNAEEAARTLDGNPISFKNAPVISPETNAALRHQLDPRQNGIHIDDIVTFIETRTDVNGDGIFDQYDVLWLLKQI